jgi:hypothetical protein
MTTDTPSPAFASHPTEAPSNLPDRLQPARIEEMRRWVETTNRSYKRIGDAVGVSASTVSRYARQEGWRRPPNAARIGTRRERVTEKLWRLTERHAEALEDQPIELAQRSFQPLARLTRMLGEMEKHAQPRAFAQDEPFEERDTGRSIHELRDELAAHLERIEREEWERWSWFRDGAGI